MAKKPLEIDACAGSQLRDSQGEMLSVEGADIDELAAGRGRWNDNHGKGFFNSIGRITHAKKIFKAEDCEDDRQKYYWEKVKAPYVYVKGYLYDDEDHPNAKAAAAILRNIHKADVPLKLKASVEGGVLSRGISDPTLLARTKIHSVALTFTPANAATLVEPLNLDKSMCDEAADMALIQSVVHLAQANVPSFRHIERDAAASKIATNLQKIAQLADNDNRIVVPTKQEIIQYALEKKVRANIETIQSAVADLMADESLDKGLKSTIAAGLAAGAMAMPSNQVAAKPPVATQPPVPKAAVSTPTPAVAPVRQESLGMKSTPEHVAVFKEIAKKNPYLAALGHVESTDGQDVDHKTNWLPGPDYGHTAAGMWGVMPNEAATALRRDKKLRAKYPQLAKEGENRYDDESVVNHKTFTDFLSKNPRAAADFAESIFKHRLKNTKNLGQLFYSWKMGFAGSAKARKEHGQEYINNHEYVQKVMSEYNRIIRERMKAKTVKPKRQLASPVKKALTAGYGGAGMPTGRVGGAIFQSESIDDGRKALRYITCDDCGKEQVHSKFQVKCRECGKSFSLKKLHKVLCG
jgi:hypothetical protein